MNTDKNYYETPEFVALLASRADILLNKPTWGDREHTKALVLLVESSFIELGENRYERLLDHLHSWNEDFDKNIEKAPFQTLLLAQNVIDHDRTSRRANEKQASAITDLTIKMERVYHFGLEKNPWVKDLTRSLDNMRSTISHFEPVVERQIAKFSENNPPQLRRLLSKLKTGFDAKLTTWDSEIAQKLAQVDELKSTALATGLAPAFEKERKQNQNSRTFFLAVFTLLLLLFFCLSWDLREQLTEKAFIISTKTVFSFALYLPIFWGACIAIKNAKMSKKLAEEYTHKEVIIKTYLGLNKEIETLSKDTKSAELKERLLTAVIDAIAYNPAKCIGNIDCTDNPMMDLATSFAKVSKSLPADAVKAVLGVLVAGSGAAVRSSCACRTQSRQEEPEEEQAT